MDEAGFKAELVKWIDYIADHFAKDVIRLVLAGARRRRPFHRSKFYRNPRMREKGKA